jgi:hypothetical protein
MFIAFEGPDNVGKSTAARELDAAAQPDYQITREVHLQNVADQEPGTLMPTCYDRIDWFSHMVYRLALPDRDWNDDRPRTVFAMPETHLVIRLHHPDFADFKADEVVDTPIAKVNPMYYWFGDHFMALNKQLDYSLFRTVSFVEVKHNQETGEFSQTLAMYDSPVIAWDDALSRVIDSNMALLDLLQEDERQRL